MTKGLLWSNNTCIKGDCQLPSAGRGTGPHPDLFIVTPGGIYIEDARGVLR